MQPPAAAMPCLGSVTIPVDGWSRRTVALIAVAGAWGGPTFGYRDTEVECNAFGRAVTLHCPGHPLDAWAFDYGLDEVVTLIDCWLDTGRMP
jgi:hypothetical protein